jgi:amino acid permease
MRNDDEQRPFPWLEIALGVNCLALFFQIFPSLWWRLVSFGALVLSYADIRSWTWRSYAVVCVITIVVLVVVKGRQNSA